MAATGQFDWSVLSASNDFTAALVNTRIDFTLFKFNPSPEYSSVGPALSAARRSDAENGPIHRTARRLTALFEQLIPNTPKLFAAYGKRATQIITRPEINPTGSAKHGPFKPFVGADGTAMWAAATSGPGAIGIYLLALFLTRMWDAKYAIGIWVDLIGSRRAEIRRGLDRGEAVPESAVMSTLQEISRSDLAEWDASARAWLRTAEQVKHVEWQLTQLSLVTKNLSLPFEGGQDTYAKVIASWTRAMRGLEDLLSGRPQEISNAAILTAFASWHLFPDLIVLIRDPTKVEFRDELIPKNAVGTISLRAQKPDNDLGITWSLLLSHLHHYGPSIEALGVASSPKVTFEKLRLAALGSLFSKWHLNQRHYIEAANFMCTLWSVLKKVKHNSGLPLRSHFGWLRSFAQASKKLLEAHAATSPDFEDLMRLVMFGARRGINFLGPEDSLIPRFFGLLNRPVLAALTSDSEVDAAINYLRCIAQSSNCEQCDGLVVYSHSKNQTSVSTDSQIYEHATLWPLVNESKKRKATSESTKGPELGHWFLIGDHPTEFVKTTLMDRSCLVKLSGALYRETTAKSRRTREKTRPWQMHWHRAPRLFSNSVEPIIHTSTSTPGLMSSVSDQTPSWMLEGDDMSFQLAEGSFYCGLILRDHVELNCNEEHSISTATAFIRRSVNYERLYEYLCHTLHESWKLCSPTALSRTTLEGTDEQGAGFVAKRFHIGLEACKALYTFALADEIFRKAHLPTISLECLEYPLHRAPWLGTLQLSPTKVYQHPPTPLPPSRERSFSCICLLDSGSVRVDEAELGGVVALCCENSIYVTAIALTDPALKASAGEIHHIVGSIGKSGISMLVAPQDPKIRAKSHDYRIARHTDYDFQRKNSFGDTTLHLSFTEWKVPLLDPDLDRTIDHEVHFIESVISVRESGRWVADLDILSIDFSTLHVPSESDFHASCCCTAEDLIEYVKNYDIKSVDSWEELLDDPKVTCIVRAHGNWAARLAAASILSQQGQSHNLCAFHSNKICLRCLMTRAESTVGRAGLLPYETNLPQFCID